ncbi:uncharacterized protein TOT_040000689 [Theileria orientalis strain Shintoku]|uniref:C2 domain-containing protein n=1 Tax=Theileria orientalis strain Shintoku TaxID=869250 RepID=J7MGV9_THEOR|nr:uncharacterized protein TOT_040000689 [Theileria orientalis strain Shintoku]BAM42321.1 uncharacterized protein TOT_040000689 [Theileria orientalis strain Shintoku]|eukprot:XP_009692622.1 uncharacterized protein TOT_040000689 [Theileria orientalis strain Shintoku]
MPRYSVGFTVHEAFFSSIRVKTPIDPLVVVRCFDSEFSTTVKPAKTVVACWDESCQWNNIEASQKSWNSGVIEFELQSANAFWRNDTLGSAGLQLKLISTCKNNTFSGRIPLTAPNSVSIVGYLTVTVNAYDLSHEALNNAQPSVTKELEVRRKTNLEIPPLTSPLVHRNSFAVDDSKVYKYFHLYINVYSLEDVETCAFGFTPHITCEYAGCRLEFSRPIKVKGISSGFERASDVGPAGESLENKSSLDLLGEKISSYMGSKTRLLDYNTELRRSNYTFNQCFLMPIRVTVGEPTLEDNIILRVWKGYSLELSSIFSKNSAGKRPVSSKLLAEGVFSLSKLRSTKQKARWFNFYRTSESDFITSVIAGSEDQKLDNDAEDNIAVKSGINESYAGRILMSASVKRINKLSDILRAHVVASHQLDPLSPSPTRIFCDVFFVESSNDFSFTEPFEICLELSCGPYTSATDWQTVSFRSAMASAVRKDIDFLGRGMKNYVNEEYFGSSLYSMDDFDGRQGMGWVCNFDSVQGRLNPMELLVAYKAEERWYIFVRVLARRTGEKNVTVLGSSKFTFDDLASYKPNMVKVPVWLSLTTAERNLPDNIITNTLNLLSDLDNASRGLSRTSSVSTADTEHPSGRSESAGSFTANPSFLNVLLSLEKEMFYSTSLNSSANKQFRVASHSRRASLVLMDYELRLYVYSAKMDRIYENVSVSVVCDGRRRTTSSRRTRSLFPVFMECLSMPVSAHTPVNNIVPNVPILVTLNRNAKEERNVYSTEPGERNSKGDNGKHGKLVKRRVRVDVTDMLCSAVVTYNRLISSAKAHDRTGGVPRWLKIGDCKLLLFVDLVAKSAVRAVPKFQMLPDVQNTTVKLGLLGIRNLRNFGSYGNQSNHGKQSNQNSQSKHGLEAGQARKGALVEENLVVRASVQNYGICTDDEQYYEFLCKSEFFTSWVSDGKKNYDLFAVHSLEFKTPVAAVFDPLLELKIMPEHSDEILGHCCMPLYQNRSSLDKHPYLRDLRYSLVPRKMFETFEALQAVGNKGSYQLTALTQKSSSGVDGGLAEVLQQFQETRQFKTMVKSLEFESVSASVPPKILIAADGRKVENSSSLTYSLVSDTNIEDMLTDVPYSIKHLLLESDRATYDYERTDKSKTSSVDHVEMASIKYFLSVSDERGYSYSSCGARYRDVSVQPDKMFQAFRGGLKSDLFKLRLCILSCSSFPRSEEDSSTYLAVEIASRESRELLDDSEGLIRNINKSYERELFLPEHSLIIFKAIESSTTLKVTLFAGDSVESLIATGYIDLENRWFSKTWQSMQRNDNVPIERIVLCDKGSVQGHVNVLVQLAKIDKFPMLKTINLTLPPTSSVEIRVVIWSVRDAKIPYSENKKDMLDLYVASKLDCHTYSGSHDTEQRTDIHYNCDSGNASFNWRIVYPEVKTPLGACHLQLSLYDFWKIGNPTFLGDANLELSRYIDIVSTTGNMVRVDGEVPLYPSAKSAQTGFVHVTLHVLTQSEANTKNVGLGRDEPNRDPYLIVPNVGRQWQDWLAHTGISIDFSGYHLYFRIVGCLFMLVWLVVIAFIYPAILL